MSDYDATEMDGEEQSEDGEIVKSPVKHSPLPLSKDTADFIQTPHQGRVNDDLPLLLDSRVCEGCISTFCDYLDGSTLDNVTVNATIKSTSRVDSMLSEKPPDLAVMSKLLSSLPSRFSAFTMTWECTAKDKRKKENLITRIICEDKRLTSMEEESSSLALHVKPLQLKLDQEAEDTADSLDIKPPQAAVAHHHKSSSRIKRDRDKHLERDQLRREHAHSGHNVKLESVSTHRKGRHHSRVEHREHREEKLREKRHHRQRHEAALAAARETKRERGRERERDREESIVSSRERGESMVSSRDREESIVSTSRERGESMLSSSRERGESMMSSSRERGESMLSSRERGESMLSSRERGESMLSSRERGESTLSSRERGESMMSSRERGDSIVSSRERVESTMSSRERVESTMSSRERGESTMSSSRERGETTMSSSRERGESNRSKDKSGELVLADLRDRLLERRRNETERRSKHEAPPPLRETPREKEERELRRDRLLVADDKATPPQSIFTSTARNCAAQALLPIKSSTFKKIPCHTNKDKEARFATFGLLAMGKSAFET
uniref:Uncharacterized protein n=1 Tax=Timema monikensis TaxID=170555 RepID=A0A7R9HJW9_9NEOP|nr:unnamed protein product [Timema monikensis]